MKKVLLFLCAMLTLNAMALTYKVTVPTGTKACYIAGEMNEWKFQEMEMVDETHYTIEIADATNAQKYKYACGPDWQYVEKTSGNGDVSDRTYNANDNVAKWAKGYTPETFTIPEGLLSFNEGENVVFYINSQKWNNVNAYAWNNQGNNGSWPGVAITKVNGVTITGSKGGPYDVYMYKVAKTFDKIIFNNGTAQTGNLDFKVGRVYGGDGKYVTIIEPTKVVVPTISVSCPAKAFVNEPVTFSANTLNADGLTVEYLINGEVVSNPWTPTQVATYTLTANLKDGATVKATSEPQTIAVYERRDITVYLKMSGAWENTKIHYWGDKESNWPGEVMETIETVDGIDYYSYTIEGVHSVSILFNNKEGDAGNQTVDINDITGNVYYELGENVDGKYTVKEPAKLDENITYNNSYLLRVEGDGFDWRADNAKFGAWFYNNNLGYNNGILVEGYTFVEKETGNNVETVKLFYLDEHHVKDILKRDISFTGVIFLRLKPEYEFSDYTKFPVESDDDDIKEVWNKVQADDCPGPQSYFELTGMEAGEWRAIPSALDRVELANGIGYAYGVVSAEGAIEVYNVNGAVVARGNDTIDLRGLGRGVYIIRNGNQVRKVVR